LICDFREERWPSMDLFGDMLYLSLRAGYAPEFQVEQLLPAIRPRLSKIPRAGLSGVRWNADRLLNRFHDYPRWLRTEKRRFDLFHIVDHSYSQLALELPPQRTVITCHDLDTFRSVFEPAAEPRPGWFRAMTRKILRGFQRATHVICPSASTKGQILAHQLFSPDQVTVIAPGVDPVFFEPASLHINAILGDNVQPYVLHVGSNIRRKRIDVLLRVFARIAPRFPQLRLVRVGGPLTDEMSRLARELGISPRIIQAPHLSKAELAAVYSHATLLLQTSDAEGFGLPVIEAMACGCPVIASDIAPLREAGGTAAEFCPVAEEPAWAETLLKLLRQQQDAPGQWDARRDEARRHAARFTWGENARQTVAVYRQVLAVPMHHRGEME